MAAIKAELTLRIQKSVVSATALAAGISLSLVGYTAILMIVVNTPALAASTRVATVPLRLLIVALLAIACFTNPRRNNHPAIPLFVGFSFLYFTRIAIAWASPDGNLYQTPVEFLSYFASFVVLPFLLIAFTRFSELAYRRTLQYLLISACGFVFLTVAYYGNLVGEVGRLSYAITRDENYVSPLALSYTSTLVIGIIVALFVGRRHLLPSRVLLLVVLSFGLLIPFFLGASRGSVVAIALLFAFLAVFHKGFRRRTGLLMLCTVGMGVIWYAQIYLGAGLFTRIANLQSGIESGSSAAIRLALWRDGIAQYLSHPVFGNSLQVESFQYHPHNLFIESAIATGTIGLFAFSMFVASIFVGCITVLRNRPDHAWVSVAFLIGFASNMFSGAIAGASVMAIGAGLVVATANYRAGPDSGSRGQ